MEDKNIMNNDIKITGMTRLSDLPEALDDSLSKNLLSTYFLGAQLYSSLVNEDYMLPYVYRERKRKISREY